MNFRTPQEIKAQIAEHVRARRIKKELTQAELSKRAEVSLSSYKRFEQIGEISFDSLIRIAVALRIEMALLAVFENNETEYASLDEVEKSLEIQNNKRSRVRKTKS